ncbi:hypothetical protein C900_05925 [Fulvivirga imtechensis AK7]|uniref:J domain-containing protein n=1 Tax=Fulvivirga imtechensis AK7 TaxID=1237149 RepID=L8JME3_9BACT|nr:DnaJ domain-containing protein [Fulvivirga imtechensis]ELR68694.1 hypothetical protein C900_05925 [Fulvivirga imtechensis AK7]
MIDYYNILQVDREASQEVIKAAYKRLAVEYHPDKSDHPEATQKFQEICQAYHVLGHEGKRLMYDLSLIETFQLKKNYLNGESDEEKRRIISSFGKRSYQELIADYVKYARYISRIAFIFCLFLFLDYYMPHQKSIEKIIFIEREDGIYGSSSGRELIVTLYTDQNTVLRLPDDDYDFFNAGDEVVVSRTRITDSTIAVARAFRPGTSVNVRGSIYGPKIIMVFALAFCALMGGFIYPTAHGTFSFGVASTFLMITVLILL